MNLRSDGLMGAASTFIKTSLSEIYGSSTSANFKGLPNSVTSAAKNYFGRFVFNYIILFVM